MRLRGGRHVPDHAGQHAGAAVAAALPEAAPRPGLQHGHAEQEQPEPGQYPPAEPGGAPLPVRQRHQQAGHTVEGGRARRAEQERLARREDPAEGLAEHPDHQAPARAGQPGEPGRPASGRSDQPGPDAELDPDRRGAGLDRVIRPAGPGPVHQVLDPAGGTRRGRLDDLGRQPGRHGRLRLEQPVEDPDDAEPDPQQPPGHGLAAGLPAGPGCLPGGPGGRNPLPDADPGHPERGEQGGHDEPLVQQRGLERRDQDRVADVETGVHAWHRACLLSWVTGG